MEDVPGNTSEDSRFEDSTDENCPEIKSKISADDDVWNDVKLTGSGRASSESGLPSITAGKNYSCCYLGKKYEDRKLLLSNLDKTLKELKALLSSEVTSLMQETDPIWQVMRRVNTLTEENIDFKTAIDESTCNEQSLDESFEVLL